MQQTPPNQSKHRRFYSYGQIGPHLTLPARRTNFQRSSFGKSSHQKILPTSLRQSWKYVQPNQAGFVEINKNSPFVRSKNQPIKQFSQTLKQLSSKLDKISDQLTAKQDGLSRLNHQLKSCKSQPSLQYEGQQSATYYIGELFREGDKRLVNEHIEMSLKIIANTQQYLEREQSIYRNCLQQDRLNGQIQGQSAVTYRHVLVLDLDQTLIHCFQAEDLKHAQLMNIQVETDLNLKAEINGQIMEFGIKIRPYALGFLRRMARYFWIYVFTASHQRYADTILDSLDPDSTLISKRFYRQHCLQLPNNLYAKDLTILGHPLSEVVLVDNAAYSYCLQLDNGIPILSYFSGRDDQLLRLQKYLIKLTKVRDVRSINRRTFQLYRYAQFMHIDKLIAELYGQEALINYRLSLAVKTKSFVNPFNFN